MRRVLSKGFPAINSLYSSHRFLFNLPKIKPNTIQESYDSVNQNDQNINIPYSSPQLKSLWNESGDKSCSFEYPIALNEDGPFPNAEKMDQIDHIYRHNQNKEQFNNSLCKRINDLDEKQSICLAFQKWMGEGLPVTREDISYALSFFKKCRNYHRCFQIAEWVIRERPYRLQGIEYYCLIEFAGKAFGDKKAEELVASVPWEFQKDAYSCLVIVLIRSRSVYRAKYIMRKMRWLGLPISTEAYNCEMWRYFNNGHYRRIGHVLTQMKADGVVFNRDTFNILLRAKGHYHDIKGLRRVFQKMLQLKVQPDHFTYCNLAKAFIISRMYDEAKAFADEATKVLTNITHGTAEILLYVYGALKNEEGVKRIWNHAVDKSYLSRYMYIHAVEAFGEIGRIDKAEEIWKEMMARREKKLTMHYNAILSVYARHGLIMKAKQVYYDMRTAKFKPDFLTYLHLICCCLRANKVCRAIEISNKLFSGSLKIEIKNSTPMLEASLRVLEAFADKGNIDFAEKYFKYIQHSRYGRDVFAFNTLLKAYVKANVPPDTFIRRMASIGIFPNSETIRLWKLKNPIE